MGQVGTKILGEIYNAIEGIASWVGLDGLVRRIAAASSGYGFRDISETDIIRNLNEIIAKASDEGPNKLEELERKLASFPILTNYVDRSNLMQSKKTLQSQIKDQQLRNDVAEMKLAEARRLTDNIANSRGRDIVVGNINKWKSDAERAVSDAEKIVKGVENGI